MVQKAVEGLFAIAIIGLILKNGSNFADVVTKLGSNYANLVRGLRP